MMRTPPLPGVPGRQKGDYDAVIERTLPAAVVLQPRTYRELQRGINSIANAVRPTLGPLARFVLIEAQRRIDKPEFLDDAATIARRIIQIRPRGNDVGAMLIRQSLWRMRREAGDGAATMAVMYQAILNEGIRSVVRLGHNAMQLRSGLEKGLAAVLESLGNEALPLTGKERIAVWRAGWSRKTSRWPR